MSSNESNHHPPQSELEVSSQKLRVESLPELSLEDSLSSQEESPQVKEETPSVKSGRRWMFLGVAIATLTVGSIFGWRWWQFQSTHISTDNAQIDGHLSPIAPKVQGTIQQVLVKEGDTVKAGQTLVVLDGKDLNLQVQ
ncbi:MAG: biotin/lipoyl-binding protein, partial [Thermosynechococcaceae cyanobacterium]